MRAPRAALSVARAPEAERSKSVNGNFTGLARFNTQTTTTIQYNIYYMSEIISKRSLHKSQIYDHNVRPHRLTRIHCTTNTWPDIGAKHAKQQQQPCTQPTSPAERAYNSAHEDALRSYSVKTQPK